MEYLKDSYKWSLRVFTIINVAVFWGVVILGADISAVTSLIASISPKEGIIALIAPIGTFVLDGLISADNKARLIYWRYHNPLPGSLAFTRYLKTDSRIEPSRLSQRWGKFPSDPVEQNRLWYQIYKRVENEIRVREAHRASLYSRDLTTQSALFLVFFGIAIFFSNTPWNAITWYLLVLAVQYLALMVAARTYGIRFVQTVLAIASHSIDSTSNGREIPN